MSGLRSENVFFRPTVSVNINYSPVKEFYLLVKGGLIFR